MTENPRDIAQGAIEDYLGERLQLAQQPPGIREAVGARFAAKSGDIAQRGKDQIKQLKARSPNRPPVYYAHEEVLETDLQQVAAGIRTAMAMEGHIVDATAFEQAATSRLASTAAWAIRSEAARVPRPSTRPSTLAWTLPPVPWLNETTYNWPPPEATALERAYELPGEEPARCAEAPYDNWVQLGLVERQRTYATSHPAQPGRSYTIAAGLEVTNGAPAEPRLPFFGSVPAIWTHTASELVPEMSSAQARANLAALARPLTALLDFETTPGVPHPFRAPGLHAFLLAPHIELTALLQLRPETPASRLMLSDDTGPAVVCRQWSAFPIHDGNYEPLEPAITGTDLLLRPDLYDTVVEAIGSTRLRVGFSLRVSS